MAYQHFYSCVPARASMFNKVDGYDTFVASSIFTKEYIDDNLSPLLEYRPTKYELPIIRRGKLPPVYCQFKGKQNQIIQSCISYIPSDYTGERSSCMIHSLVISDAEKQEFDAQYDRQVLNPAMFVTDIAEFKITRATTSPKFNYPETEYKAERILAVESLVTAYDPVPLKRFIYALLLAACGKGKTVYVTLNKPLEQLSSAALDLMNTLLQVFPHTLRDNISFVTYLSEYNKLNLFDVKFLPADCMPQMSGKGYMFNMTRSMPDGIRDEDYRAAELVVNFMYGLLTNKPLRSRFIKFAERAVVQEPSLKQPNIKNLIAMVTLFRQICKAFTEKQLLPDDDRVLDMFKTYEKYRTILSPSERCLVYNSLTRYKRLHQAIPQQVFNKIVKLYPDEPEKVKVTVMKIMLDLIHTDIMRDKLFAFIKSNFDSEPQRSRSLICRNLVRVYYGGFLQSQILTLYSEHFGEESESTQDYIFSRLMLSIRTPAVQQPLMVFLQKYYDTFTYNQKKVLYRTFFEMLPEADELADLILDFINAHAERETDEVTEIVTDRLVKIVDQEARKTGKLIDLVFKNGGFCEKTVLTVMLPQWNQRKIFRRYLELLKESDFLRAADSLYNCFVAAPHVDKHVVTAVKKEADDKLLANAQNCDFFRLARIVDKYTRYANQNADSVWLSVCTNLVDSCLDPALKARICDCFNYKQLGEKLAQTLNYAEKYAFLKDSQYYNAVVAAQTLLDGKPAYGALGGLESIRAKRAECFNIAQAAESALLGEVKDRIVGGEDVAPICDVAMVVGYLRTAAFDYERVYQLLYPGYDRLYARQAGNDSRAMQKVVSLATCETLVTVVRSTLRMRSSDASETLKNSVLGKNGQQGALGKLVAKHVSALNGADLARLRQVLTESGDEQLVKDVNLKKGGLLGILGGLFGK